MYVTTRKMYGKPPCFIKRLNFFHVALVIFGGADVALAITTKMPFVALNNEKETTRSLFLPSELLVERVVEIFTTCDFVEIYFQYLHSFLIVDS
jgi:hypothetical protein